MPDWPHLHLIINHAPVVGSLFAWLLLAASLGWRSTAVMRAALAAFVAVGILAFVAVQTGERAEDEVEAMAGVSEDRIHDHEEAAETAALGLEAVGALSLVGLLAFSRRRVPPWLAILVLVAALAPIVLVSRTAELGGRIRHPEVVEDPVFPF